MAKSLVGPWAADKLERLGKYLHAYTTIMKGEKWCEGYHYIDAFAGPGEHQIREKPAVSRLRADLLHVSGYSREQPEQQAYLEGSPRVALNLEHPFTTYVFVEMNSFRVQQLEGLMSSFGSARKIVIRKQDCNRYLLDRVVSNPKINWKKNREVVFLDPFGMQVEWKTIQAIADTNAIEILLNFPVGMAIQRLLPRNPAKLTPARRNTLDQYFGSTEWFSVMYKKSKTLFEHDIEEKIERSGKNLLNWYRERLRAAFGYASKAALIRNTRGAHLYYLLLASPNPTGARIASDILSAGEWV